MLSNVSRCFGSDQGISHWHFDHTRWRGRDNAPPEANCFAQTPDGLLWVGSPEGLFWFDGVGFEQYRPAGTATPIAEDISTVFAARDGDLWVGLRRGGILRIHHTGATHFTDNEGLPKTASVLRFAQDEDGALWAATWGGLFRFAQGQWSRIGRESGYDERSAQDIGLDRKGTLWVLSGGHLEYLPRHAVRFARANSKVGNSAFVYDSDGRIVLADDVGAHKSSAVDRSWPLPYLGKIMGENQSKPILLDKSGWLWVMSDGKGIYRVRKSLPHFGVYDAPSAIERFTKADGLTSDVMYASFEDREGNIWIGTETGVDRFTSSRFEVISGLTGSSRQTLVAGDHGSVLLTSYNRRPLRITSNGTITELPLNVPNISASYRDRAGTLWFGSRWGIFRHDGRRTTKFALPAPLADPMDDVLAITMDAREGLWVSIAHQGVYRLFKGIWTLVSNPFDPNPLAASKMYTDVAGRVWLAYEGHVVEIDSPSSPPVKFDVNLGEVTALTEHDGAVWAGGETGLAFYRDGAFHKMRTTDGEALGRVKGIVFSSSGDLWANGSPGVTSITRNELEKLQNTPTYAPHYEVFDLMAMVTGRTPPAGDATRDDHGHLWFSVANQVFLMDTDQPHQPSLSPPEVLIRAVHANGVADPRASTVVLPAGTTSLRIAYAAKTLVSSDDIQYRYRMEGLDTQWQNAGTQREVSYMSLPPGKYHFVVSASRPGGPWNAGTVMDIIVKPPFVQTRLFLYLCVLAVGFLAYLFYSVRLRQIRSEIQIRARAQFAERERIARELHDTLLQGIHGLTLRLGTLLNQVPKDSSVHRDLDDAIERTESMLIEGRRRVRDLRVEVQNGGIGPALDQIGKQLATDYGMVYSQWIDGDAPLHSAIETEIYGVAREALMNAFKHSGGTSVRSEIVFNRKFAELRISDNGSGFNSEALRGNIGNNRWGIVGMKERASRIGARLIIQNLNRSGAIVQLIIPSKVAYRQKRSATSWIPKWLHF